MSLPLLRRWFGCCGCVTWAVRLPGDPTFPACSATTWKNSAFVWRGSCSLERSGLFWADLFIWWDIVLTRNNWPVSSETLGALFGCEPVPSLGLLSNESNRRIQYIKIFPSTCESPLREVSGLDVSQIQYWPKWPFHHRSFYHHICWKHDVITSSHPFCNP